VEALLSNRVDAIYRDEFEIRRVLKRSPTLYVRFGSVAFTDLKSFLSIAICDTCVRLQEFVNYQIAENQSLFSLPIMLSAEGK